MLDARGELLRSEAAEHHRVDRSNARAGEHRADGLWHLRHVDHHAIAVAHAAPAREHAGQFGHLRTGSFPLKSSVYEYKRVWECVSKVEVQIIAK